MHKIVYLGWLRGTKQTWKMQAREGAWAISCVVVVLGTAAAPQPETSIKCFDVSININP
jgi:hypothetical protein